MKLKISVKTILLLVALFILATMILGFYSCSGSQNLVAPQATDDNLVTDIGDLVDGTVPPPGTTTPVPPPGTTTTSQDGTITWTSEYTVDQFGNVVPTTTTPRASEGVYGGIGSGQVPNDDVWLEISDFTNTGGNSYSGTILVENNLPVNLVYCPRAFVQITGPKTGPNVDAPGNSNLADLLPGFDNPDMYYAQEHGPFGERVVAHTLLFIAAEADGYTVHPGESAQKDFTITLYPENVFVITVMYDNVYAEPTKVAEAVTTGPPVKPGSRSAIPKSFGFNTSPDYGDATLLDIIIHDPDVNWDNRHVVEVENLTTHDLSLAGFAGLPDPSDVPALPTDFIFRTALHWDLDIDGPTEFLIMTKPLAPSFKMMEYYITLTTLE